MCGFGIILVLLIGVILILLLCWFECLFIGLCCLLIGLWVQGVCCICLWIMGLCCDCVGQLIWGLGVVVVNYLSWLDIFVLNVVMLVFFVLKFEVVGWLGINILICVIDMYFVICDFKFVCVQVLEFVVCICVGYCLLFFFEGISIDGCCVLFFKLMLFQGFLDFVLFDVLVIQLMMVVYQVLFGVDLCFYGWWGDMVLGLYLLVVLVCLCQGCVMVYLYLFIFVVGQMCKMFLVKVEVVVCVGFDQMGFDQIIVVRIVGLLGRL